VKGLLGFTRHVRNKNVKMHLKMKRGVGPFGKKSGFKPKKWKIFICVHSFSPAAGNNSSLTIWYLKY
jgi:hypothetical protein